MSALAPRLVAHAVPLVRRLLVHPDAQCILVTRLLIDVAQALGAEAIPLSVVALLVPDPNPRKLAYGLGDRSDGGDPLGDAGWRGHLVALVDRRWLVDATIDQANKAVPELRVAPFAVDLGELAAPFARGRLELGMVADSGAHVKYVARPGDRSYRRAEGWTRTDLAPLSRLAAEAVRRERHVDLWPLPARATGQEVG